MAENVEILTPGGTSGGGGSSRGGGVDGDSSDSKSNRSAVTPIAWVGGGLAFVAVSFIAIWLAKKAFCKSGPIHERISMNTAGEMGRDEFTDSMIDPDMGSPVADELGGESSAAYGQVRGGVDESAAENLVG
eukprot:CAMPEP_0114517564 /NCGR_PEP_ID=MMETSP0109-20121206/17963_1 /TAXON_ID=29199 /ORGANISM="Chlorarachnion reptans, Strain CCCM449" /LENGTH=131 /DNA_ID=CAMNT_0001698097 /DNA_START=629 /DNA_END=1024 /DNA_ORIENTATION=-